MRHEPSDFGGSEVACAAVPYKPGTNERRYMDRSSHQRVMDISEQHQHLEVDVSPEATGTNYHKEVAS